MNTHTSQRGSVCITHRVWFREPTQDSIHTYVQVWVTPCGCVSIDDCGYDLQVLVCVYESGSLSERITSVSPVLCV